MTRHARTLTLALIALTLASVTLSAHMKLVKTLPADGSTGPAPGQLRVWFTQAPDLKVSRLTLEGPGGAVTVSAVQSAAEQSLTAAINGALADGKYTASWQTAGTDGHVQKGTFSFTVRQTQDARRR